MYVNKYEQAREVKMENTEANPSWSSNSRPNSVQI